MKTAQMKEPIYISAVDAAKLIGISTRTMHRWIEDGKVPARHHGSNQLHILLTDVEALVKERPAVVTPLSLLQEHAAIIEELRTQIGELLATNAQLVEKITAQDGRIEQLERLVRREYEAQSILQKLMSLRSDALESVDISTLREKRAEVGRLVRDLSLLEKRKLPPGSLTLSTFCKRHSGPGGTVHASTVKGMVEAIDRVGDLVTIWNRPMAATHTHEWWVTPAQQQDMILFWQELGKPFEPCPDCPHAVNTAEPGAEQTISDEMPSAEMVS
jgi:hypothetical protein